MPRSLPDITELEALGPRDAEVLDELRQVLTRHDALDRFGITLLHDHFEVSDEELLVEVCEPDTRTLTTKPVPRAELLGAGRLIETQWEFHDSSLEPGLAAKLVCKLGCFVDLKDRHKRVHDKVQG